MRILTHKSSRGDGITFCYKLYSLSDIINLEYFPTSRFPGFKDMLQMSEENKAKVKAREIFSDFLNCVARDMVEDNDIFIFPRRNFAFMKISNMAGSNHPNFSYDIEKAGKIYTVKIKSHKDLVKKNKKHYTCTLKKSWLKRMVGKIKNGHKY